MIITEVKENNLLLDESKAAQFLGLTSRCLQVWRYHGGGPTYIRISRRAIRYRMSDLVRFVEERAQTSTSIRMVGAKTPHK